MDVNVNTKVEMGRLNVLNKFTKGIVGSCLLRWVACSIHN